MTNQTEKTTVRRLDKTDLKILSILQRNARIMSSPEKC